MEDAVIISSVRTPIGAFGGALSSVSAVDLGATVIAESLKRANLEVSDIDEVIMGNVLSVGLGMNVARQSAIKAGIPVSTPAMTINKMCGSGLKAIILAAQAVRCGDADVVVAGGTENMSQSPFLIPKARWGYRMGNGEIVDVMLNDGLYCNIANCHMGITAENLAEMYEVSREDMDVFAVESQTRANQAMEAKMFADEIIPVDVPQSKGECYVMDTDEHPRSGTTVERLARLQPAFLESGTVTAGNAAGINDGAASVVVMSLKRSQSLGIRPLARIRSYASAGVEPRIMGIGPVPAIRKALGKAQLSMNDIGLVELNEAFAAQSLAVGKELDLDWSRTNVNGGAIALGHPIGASGARILTTLLHEMTRRNTHNGLASLCIGGGQGIALVVENAS